MVQSSKSSASDAMVDFFEQDHENPTLPLYYDLADRYIFSAWKKPAQVFICSGSFSSVCISSRKDTHQSLQFVMCLLFHPVSHMKR